MRAVRFKARVWRTLEVGCSRGSSVVRSLDLTRLPAVPSDVHGENIDGLGVRERNVRTPHGRIVVVRVTDNDMGEHLQDSIRTKQYTNCE